MAIVNTSIAPLLKEGSNVTLTQDGQVITIASTGGGGGGTPGGSDTQVQFNDGGSFGGDTGLTYDKTNNILDVESLDFATTPTAAAATYRLNTDDAEGSLNLGLKGGNVNIAVGAEVVIMSYNAEATTLNKGEVVYLYGAQGQRPSVKRADNTSDATSATTFGMVAESIASGGEGFVIQIGVLRNINTNSYNEGDILYLGTSGGVTTTKQYAPNHNVFVGVVLKKNASSGRIFVKPQNGYELDEIHDVKIVSKQNGDVIAYDSTLGLWKNTLVVRETQYRFETVTTMDQDIWLYASTITKVVKAAGINTVEYKINAGSYIALTFTSGVWTGSISIAANDVLTWRITYNAGYTTGSFNVVHNRV